MREIKFGEQLVRVRATPLALLFYKQEFKRDLLGDLVKMEKIESDLSEIDSIALLQLVYVMAKADAFGGSNPFPSFQEWIGSLESVDFADPDFLAAVLEEAANGFFRTGAKKGAKPAK
ncbi:hypothetical protein D3C72_247720 [compost metagenome]